MPANTIPIHPLTPVVSWGTVVTAANTAYDGTGTVTTLFTAGVDGARLDEIRFKPLGTNVATLIRIFINNGLANTTAANNVLWDEIPVAASTSSIIAGLPIVSIRGPGAIPAGYKINMTIATAVAAGWVGAVAGGNY